jgi:hypothetical protein
MPVKLNAIHTKYILRGCTTTDHAKLCFISVPFKSLVSEGPEVSQLSASCAAVIAISERIQPNPLTKSHL